ncbi:MAG: IS4 family transposase [Chroococcidiopsidaceae cyanobacterium CP_BM_RX_35]|nr:IS4 family transposase [Chroococcidiopsidaceae cyanobacterium CP_BM_RX_35]
MLPPLYQTHLQSQLSRSEYLLITLLVNLLQSIKQTKLETLATALSFPITFESRRKKIQRFLSLPQLTLEKIWFSIVKSWLETELKPHQVLYIAIDRTKWGRINLLMISLIWDKRAFPIYWELLPKQGNSNFEKQTLAISQVLSLFKEYKVVVLGDREFCSVKLGNWLREKHVYFCLRLKCNEFVQLEEKIWLQLEQLGLVPGMQLYLDGVSVTKQKGFGKFNVASKWKRKYSGWAPDEGWFILTNLPDLKSAILAYRKRFGIEEMFRDFKSGGYNLEGTNVTGDRLVVMVLLIAMAYTTATIWGREIKNTGRQKYIGRVKEAGRTQRRHSSFYIGLSSQTWVDFRDSTVQIAAELMRLNCNKLKYYQKGQRAMKLILSAL